MERLWIKVSGRVQGILRHLLGIYTCGNCGVAHTKGGMPVFMGRKVNGDEILGYYCERCSNQGFIYEEVKAAFKYFKDGEVLSEQEK